MSRLRGIAIDLQPLRDSRPFRLLWIGQTVSLLLPALLRYDASEARAARRAREAAGAPT